MARWAPHLIGLLTPISAAVTLLIGGWWMLTPIILLLGLYPFLDSIAGSSTVHDVEEEGRGHNVIVHLHGILVPIVVICLLYRIWAGLGSVSIVIPAISAGLATGAAGVVAAHELGHRKPRSSSWWLGRLDLLCVLYLHFTVEHNHTHHKHGPGRSILRVLHGGVVSMVILYEPFLDNSETHTESGKRTQPSPFLSNLHCSPLLLYGVCRILQRLSVKPSLQSICLNL